MPRYNKSKEEREEIARKRKILSELLKLSYTDPVKVE